MKKIVLLLVMFAAIAVTSAQSIQLLYNGEIVGDTLNYEVTDPSGSCDLVLNIRNLDSNNVQVFLQKEVLAEVTDSYNSFCIGDQCWASTVMTNYPNHPLNLSGNEESTAAQFHITYNCYGCQPGTTTVKYVFWTGDDHTNGDSVVVNFTAGTQGIADQPLRLQNFSAYPNPATSKVTILYDLQNRSAGDAARILLTDMVGNKVRSFSVSNASGKCAIDLSDLVAGIYFYSLEVNGNRVATKKLIVR